VTAKCRRPGFVTYHRDGLAYLREKLGRNRAAMCVFLELIAEADIQTGEVLGSVRGLTARLGLRRETFANWLRDLEAAGLVEVDAAPHRCIEGRIVIPRYKWFIGEVDAPSPEDGTESEPPGGPVGGPESVPATWTGGPVGGPVSGPESVPRDTLLPATTHLRPSRPSRSKDPQDELALPSSSLRGSSALAQDAYEDDRGLNPWSGLSLALTQEGFDENDIALALARLWCGVRDPRVPLEGERRRVPTLAEVREELTLMGREAARCARPWAPNLTDSSGRL